MSEERITLQDSLFDMMFKLSEGNPGALTVCMQMHQQDATIDPDAFLGGLMPLLGLDTLGIYGPSIWILYKDICGENLTKMLGVLRGWQLGFISPSEIHQAIDGCRNGLGSNGIDTDLLLSKVQERLPNFGQGAREP